MPARLTGGKLHKFVPVPGFHVAAGPELLEVVEAWVATVKVADTVFVLFLGIILVTSFVYAFEFSIFHERDLFRLLCCLLLGVLFLLFLFFIFFDIFEYNFLLFWCGGFLEVLDAVLGVLDGG